VIKIGLQTKEIEGTKAWVKQAKLPRPAANLLYTDECCLEILCEYKSAYYYTGVNYKYNSRASLDLQKFCK